MAQDRNRNRARPARETEQSAASSDPAARGGAPDQPRPIAAVPHADAPEHSSTPGPAFYARAQRRQSSRRGTGVQARPEVGRAEGGGTPSMEDIARGYGVERGGLYGSRSAYTLGRETDTAFRNRAESVSPYFGDNLGTGLGYGASERSDLGPGIGANRAYGYGAVPSYAALPRYGATGLARNAARRTPWRREPLTVREMLAASGSTVRPDTLLREAARIMREERVWLVPVVDDDGVLHGVVTDHDIVTRAVADGQDPARTRTADIMTRDADAVTSDESVIDVISLMGERHLRRVPVVDARDRLLGVVSMADIAARADFDTELQSALEDITLRRSFWRELE
ncbi:MAG TPA: CBS domain-containing protein [Gemmatimonadaceae bacterium]|nr:CBS domain-containing protein [Gemmatimonadaceae bacterium]